MSADSGKPDAGVVITQLAKLQCDLEASKSLPWVDLDSKLAKPFAEIILADFQRETLLWAASQFSDYLTKKTLERLAESCGRGK